jgi:hypothetical protein
MNETISSVLREHADGDIHIERLLGAVYTSVRRRRQRRIASVVAAAVAVAVLLVAASAVSGGRPATPASPPPMATVPVPPHGDATPAARTAGVLGSDPRVFHLGVSDLSSWDYLSWAAHRSGGEELEATTESGGWALIEAATSRESLRQWTGQTSEVTVGGRPAEAVASSGTDVVRWQPVPGIWAQAAVRGELRAVAVAEQLRLDQVYRCAVPFRLDRIVPARLNKCRTYYSIDQDSGRWVASGDVWFTLGTSGVEYQVSVGKTNPKVAVDDVIQGRAVQVTEGSENGTTYPEIRYPYPGHTAYFWAFYGPVDQTVYRSLVPAFRPVLDEDPHTWPSSPFA